MKSANCQSSERTPEPSTMLRLGVPTKTPPHSQISTYNLWFPKSLIIVGPKYPQYVGIRIPADSKMYRVLKFIM